MQEPASKKEATPVLTENFGLTRDTKDHTYAFLCPSLGSPSADMKTQDQRRPFIFVPARDLQRSGCSVSMTDRTRRQAKMYGQGVYRTPDACKAALRTRYGLDKSRKDSVRAVRQGNYVRGANGLFGAGQAPPIWKGLWLTQNASSGQGGWDTNLAVGQGLRRSCEDW